MFHPEVVDLNEVYMLCAFHFLYDFSHTLTI